MCVLLYQSGGLYSLCWCPAGSNLSAALMIGRASAAVSEACWSLAGLRVLRDEALEKHFILQDSGKEAPSKLSLLNRKLLGCPFCLSILRFLGIPEQVVDYGLC